MPSGKKLTRSGKDPDHPHPLKLNVRQQQQQQHLYFLHKYTSITPPANSKANRGR